MATRSSASRRILLGVVVAAGVGGAVVAGLRRARDPGTDVAANAMAPKPAGASEGVPALAQPEPIAKSERTVTMTIDSEPEGAAVTDVESGQLLGATPVEVSRPALQGRFTARLEKSGFAPTTRVFHLDRDRTESVSLLPVAADESGRPANQGVAGKAKKAPRTRHGSSAQSRLRPDDEPAKL